MRLINHYSHIPFISEQLSRLLPPDSFAFKLRKTIGKEINAVLEEGEYALGTGGTFFEKGNYSDDFPVQALFFWISKDGGLTLDDLENGHGSFLDDTFQVIPAIPRPSLTAVEQMAAFGLWFLDVEINICGPTTDADYD